MFARSRLQFLILQVLSGLMLAASGQGQEPLVEQTNSRLRVVAANLTSGNYQRYEAAGLAILKGLRPDIVAIQEFNYASASFGQNSPAAFREMIDLTFGPDFVYFRESSPTENYTIPNGIVSRYPILSSGSWNDPYIPDRGFAWAEIDLPGTNVLFVVSVHLKASSSSAGTRAAEAAQLKTLLQSSFPANAFIVLAGDLNISEPGETALATLKTFLVDAPIPTDAVVGGDPDTNLARSERYDYVLPNARFAQLQTAVVIGTQPYPAGLVFDSRVFGPLSDVPPVTRGDSSVAGMQHMPVMKDFIISYTVTNQPLRPPSIWLQPASLTVDQGQDAVFRVGADGTAPLSFYWRFDSRIIAGPVGDSLICANVQPTNVGPYSVIVSNAAGTIASSNALLTLRIPGPLLSVTSTGIGWTGLSNFAYVVQTTFGLDSPSWSNAGALSSPSGKLVFPFTNQASGPQQYFRVLAP